MAEASDDTSSLKTKAEKDEVVDNKNTNINNRNLRDHLLDALSKVPGTREFHLHVLVTSPRKGNGGGLFPFAKPRPPRVYEQEILLLLSEQQKQPLKPELSADDDEDEGKGPRVIVCAVETTVFCVPSTRSAVVYVSKVDSTGQGLKDAPKPTGTLVRSLLNFYLDPKTRPVDAENVWVQLFARAQGQYLFPNSTEWEGKKPLGDVQLCGWWKRVLTRVKEDVEGKEGVKKVGMYYILPGMSESEAGDALRMAAGPSSTTPTGWVYGHPYSQTDIGLPCPPPIGEKNLGHYIPSFEDDPKSRFMDEIAYTTEGEIKSPQRKRARTVTAGDRDGEGDGGGQQGRGTGGTKTTTEVAKASGELSKVGVDEFWERMSFRQECVAGAVTGFFGLGVTGGWRGVGGEMIRVGAGEVSLQIKKRVMSTLLTGVEFSTAERAAKATETVEGAIRGLCEGIPIANPGRKPSTSTHLQVPTTPPRRTRPLPVDDSSSPNPFSEPVASLETYYGYIYGSVSTRNAVEAGSVARKEVGAVRVLAARRKRNLK